MSVALIEHPDMGAYRFSGSHPLRPERFTLAIALMRSWALVADTQQVNAASGQMAVPLIPQPADETDLLSAHSREYIAAVQKAARGSSAGFRFGIGPGDTPAFPGMHEAAALAAGGSVRALEAVLSGEFVRAYNPAGGLHHAQRDRASGFCIYNDCVVAIERAIALRPGLRVAYVDIDAHHGDGVEAAFSERADVLTLSVHESGRYLFPGTGRAQDRGTADGSGFTINVPLPPSADAASYSLVLSEVITPGLRSFAPDVIVLQAGGDSHRNDPLTHLHNSVAGFDSTVRGIIALSDQLCGGRIIVTGGGGYDTFSAVPRMWACAMARLLGHEPPLELPGEWRHEASERAAAAGVEWVPVSGTFDEWVPELSDEVRAEVLGDTAREVERLRADHPLLA